MGFVSVLQANSATFRSVNIAANLATCIWNDGFVNTVEQLFSGLILKLPDTLIFCANGRDNFRHQQRGQRTVKKIAKNTVPPRLLEELAVLHHIPPKLKEVVASKVKSRKRKADVVEDYETGTHDF